MTQTADAPRRSFRDEVRNAVTPRAALLVLGVLALQLLFIASYVGALHNPDPKDIKVAVVAPEQASAHTVRRLERLPGSPLKPRTLPDEASAREQMLNRDIDAAVVIDPRGETDRLLTASGQGSSETQVIERLFQKVEQSQNRSIKVEDIAPADAQDADGLSSFYLIIGWCVGGYLCAAILAISAGARPENLSRAVIRLLAMVPYSIASGLLGAVVVGPILGALPGSLLGLWGLGALVVFSVGAATLALQTVFGIVGIGLAILLIVVAGNPSAGGAFPLPLIPPFWQAIGPALPPGAGTWVARSIAYFRGNSVTGSLLVLSAWAVAGALITLVGSALRGNRRDRKDTATGPASPHGDATSGAHQAPGGLGRPSGLS